MKNKKLVAIIPASSILLERFGGGMSRLCGHPMFLYSVWYAMNEGYVPVVVSDNEEVLDCAKCFLADTVRCDGDTDLFGCIGSVLGEDVYGDCELFALLQPTLPIRDPGLLREMTGLFIGSGSSDTSCVFTATGVNLLGSMVYRYTGEDTKPNEFYGAYNADNAEKRFEAFNGNIVVFSREAFEKTGNPFNNGDGVHVYDTTITQATFICIRLAEDLAIAEGILCHPMMHDYNPVNNLPNEYRYRFLWHRLTPIHA